MSPAFSSYASLTAANTPTCVDLFCGAGGMTLGFCQAGGCPLAAVDNDATSMDTYRRMFPQCPETFCGDIENWTPTTSGAAIDVVIGGPPCQGFSLARGLRFVDDPRNHLFKQFVRLAAYFSPRWIVMENVEGIINLGEGAILTQVQEEFSSIGYRLDWRTINMASYGVPQTRRRTIFVGNNLGLSFSWPEQTHYPRCKGAISSNDREDYYVAVGDALGDLPWPLGKWYAHRANSQMRGPRNRSVMTDPSFTLRVRGDEFGIRDTPAEGVFVPGPLPDVEFVYRPAAHSYQTMMREEPPPWLPPRPFIPICPHPVEPLQGSRRLSMREQARLQSFPDWFTLEGGLYAQGRQIGNAVPPLFARQLFTAILAQDRARSTA